ncbi:MAG: hypothetical protein ACI9WU_002005 [Myxococcota bacterium]|jgi:hypothetical protein
MIYAGIVGRTTKLAPGPIQADSFARLERFIGRLELARSVDFPAMHAAYHALANGVDRVVFSGVEEPHEDQSWVEALKRLFTSDPLPLVMAPGGPSEVLGDAFRQLPFTRTSVLWVEGPAVQDYQVMCCDQVIPTVAPGRRSPDGLLGAALIGPLHLGATQSLNGRFGEPSHPGLLQRSERGTLELGIKLNRPGPRLPPKPDSQVSSTTFRIDRALAQMVEPILLTEPVTPALYKRLEREAHVILQSFVRRGEIVSFRAHCDEWASAGEGGPVIEVAFREPKMVDEVLLRCKRM